MVKYIELNAFLKINNIATTGGMAKLIIRSEKVKVNSVVEIRNKRKLLAGDIVEVEGKRLIVKEEVLKMQKNINPPGPKKVV
jgi:ribosome-associated protein